MASPAVVSIALTPRAEAQLAAITASVNARRSRKASVQDVAWLVLHAVLMRPECFLDAIGSIDEYSTAEGFNSPADVILG